MLANIFLNLSIWWWLLFAVFIIDNILLRRRVIKYNENSERGYHIALNSQHQIVSLERRMRAVENTTEYIIDETGVNVVEYQEETGRADFFLGDPGGITIESMMDDRLEPTTEPDRNVG